MKRLLIPILLVSALAVPASAIAVDTQAESVSSAKAAKAKGFSVGFNVAFSMGEPTSVNKFKFKRLRVDCDQGRVLLNGKNFPNMPVTNDEFSGDFSDGGGGHVTIEGKFNGAATKVKGTVAADGTFPNSGGGGDFTGCAGSKDYTAK